VWWARKLIRPVNGRGGGGGSSGMQVKKIFVEGDVCPGLTLAFHITKINRVDRRRRI
jgi:hypothetical protein